MVQLSLNENSQFLSALFRNDKFCSVAQSQLTNDEQTRNMEIKSFHIPLYSRTVSPVLCQ